MELLITAFLMGLFGLVHCITMCGSLSLAIGFTIPKERSFFRYSTAISIGRIFGYALVGAIVNYISMSFIDFTNGGIFYLKIIASLLMIGIGLHVAGLTNFINKIEVIGIVVDRILAPVKSKILPIDSITKCLLYGLFWGFLPCGLVYTALSLAITSPSPIMAAAVMLAFGIGTLPGLIGMTSFNTKLANTLKKPLIRFVFGGLIIVMAILQLYTTINIKSGHPL